MSPSLAWKPSLIASGDGVLVPIQVGILGLCHSNGGPRVTMCGQCSSGRGVGGEAQIAAGAFSKDQERSEEETVWGEDRRPLGGPRVRETLIGL